MPILSYASDQRRSAITSNITLEFPMVQWSTDKPNLSIVYLVNGDP